MSIGYVSVTDLKSYLRAMGVPSVAMVTDAQLDWHIMAGLVRYSKIRPLLAATTIATTPGVGEYELAATVTQDAVSYDILGVSELYYSPSGFTSRPTFQSQMPVWWGLNVGEFYVFDQPTIGYIWMADLKHLLQMFEGVWDLQERVDGNYYLRLMPPPTASQTLYTFVRLSRPSTKIRKTDLDVFHLCVLIETYNAMAGQSGLAQSFTDTGMSIDLGQGAEFYRSRADEVEKLLLSRTANFAVVSRSG